jgi:hypothetical protein
MEIRESLIILRGKNDKKMQLVYSGTESELA